MWWKELLFTALYTGYFPAAPGTAGTLLAMAVYMLEYYLFGGAAWVVNLIIVLIMLYPAIRLGDAAEDYFREKDPSEVVLDEAMGYWISVLFWPFSWKVVLMAFFIFRFLDIIKPYPARRLQSLRGGLGIMIDDYIAGVYTNLTLLVIAAVAYVCRVPLY